MDAVLKMASNLGHLVLCNSGQGKALLSLLRSSGASTFVKEATSCELSSDSEIVVPWGGTCPPAGHLPLSHRPRWARRDLWGSSLGRYLSIRPRCSPRLCRSPLGQRCLVLLQAFYPLGVTLYLSFEGLFHFLELAQDLVGSTLADNLYSGRVLSTTILEIILHRQIVIRHGLSSRVAKKANVVTPGR